ncbi:MAG TPA: hypothetical protein VE085_04655 [Burkholderiales bacterium]|nr:hypothetical protein [Burkholderiales bacterium]
MLSAALGYVISFAAMAAKLAVVAALAACTVSLIAALRRGRRE